MATVFNPFDKDEEEKKAQAGAPIQISQDSTESTGGTTSAIPQSQNKPTSSGRFTNLQNFVKANQPQNGGLAGQIAGKVGEQAQDVSQKVSQAKTNLQTGIETAKAPLQGINKITSKITNIARPVGAPMPDGTSPVSIMPVGQTPIQFNPGGQVLAPPGEITEDEVAKAQQALNYKYTGPTELENASQLKYDADSLATQTKNLQSEAGRFQTLRQMFNKPSYTQGQQGLDNLLLQSNPQQMSKLRALQRTAAQAQSQINNAEKTVNREVENINQETQDVQTGLRNAVTDKQKAIQDALKAKLDSTKKSYLDRLGMIESNIATDKFDPRALNELGLTEGTQLFDLDLSRYIKPTYSKDAVQNLSDAALVAGAKDFDNMQLLNKIIGSSDPTFGDAGRTNIGKLENDLSTIVDRQALLNDLNARGQYVSDAKAMQENLISRLRNDVKSTYQSPYTPPSGVNLPPEYQGPSQEQINADIERLTQEKLGDILNAYSRGGIIDDQSLIDLVAGYNEGTNRLSGIDLNRRAQRAALTNLISSPTTNPQVGI